MANDPAVPPLPDGFVLQSAPAAAAPAPDAAPQPPAGFAIQAATALPPELPVGMRHPMAGPSGDTLTDIGRRVRGAAADAEAGLVSTPRAIASGIDWLGSKVGLNPGADAALAGVDNPIHPGNPAFPSYGEAKDAIYNSSGNVEYVPETYGGRVLDQGLTAGFGALAGGGPRTIPGAVAGGAAAEAASEPAPSWAKLPSAFIGFMLGNHAGGNIASTAARASTAATQPASELYQAYKRQGVPTTLGGDVTQNPNMQFAQAFASKMPGGEDIIRDASNNAVSAWQQAVTKRASTLGPSATLQDAGTALQKSAGDWLTNFKNESNRLWGNFKLLVPGGTAVPVSNLQKTLGDITQQYGDAKGLAAVLQPKMAASLKAAVEGDAAVPAPPQPRTSSLVDEHGYPITINPTAQDQANYLTALAASGKLPWQAMQAARTRIGEMLESPDPIADTGKAALKQIYGALSADMKAGAASVSQNAAAAFDKANSYTSAGHTLLDDHITPILNATNPEAAAQYAMQQMRLGGSRVAALDQALPGAGNDLGAVALRTAAANGPGRFPAAISDIKISPEAKRVMFGPVQSDIDDLTKIANAQKTTQQLVNHSNTAVTESRSVGRVIGAAELARIGHEMMGWPGAVGGGLAGFFGPNIMGTTAARFATNPALTRMFSTPQPAPFGMPGPLALPGAALNNPALLHPLWPRQP